MPKLSICVITMNRAKQLKEALESCFSCKLPEKTEFVIIDNASTDNTERTVREIAEGCAYHVHYEKLPENLGVGGGRNHAYEKSTGEYVYVLDDDAVIDFEKCPDFFLKAINIFEMHPAVVTLTTQIYDTAWRKNRVEASGRKLAEGLRSIYMFCGGSHFLRKSFFTAPPYLPNKYGYEEIPPSLHAMNAKKINAFCEDLLVIHKPAVDKWDKAEEKNHELLIKECAIAYAIKKMMYPRIVRPLLSLANARRRKLHLRDVPDAKSKVRDAAQRFIAEYPIKEKISLKTLCRMFKDFKLSIF